MKNTPKMLEKMAASNKRMAPYCEVVDTWPRMKMDEAKQAGFQPFTTGFCVDERPILRKMLLELQASRLNAVIVIGHSRQPEIWTKHRRAPRTRVS